MKWFRHLSALAGVRAFRHRCYLIIAGVEAGAFAAVVGVLLWLTVARPAVANGPAGFSERHVFGTAVRYLSLGDEGLVNTVVAVFMITTVLMVIVLGWLWHRKLTHMLPPPEVEIPLDDQDRTRSA